MNEIVTWKDSVYHKIKLVHSQIMELEKWGFENNISTDLMTSFLSPYNGLLEQLYLEDLPYSRIIENSDLVMRYEGDSFLIENPKISLITGVFYSLRKQLTNLAKAIAGIDHITGSLPKELDLGLSAVAKGSLIIGFTIPEFSLTDQDGNSSFLGKNDPLYKATVSAVKSLGSVTKIIAEEGTMEDLEKEFPDPKIRDVAIIAAKNISPSGRSEIKRVGLSSRIFSPHSINSLTIESRKAVKAFLKKPVLSNETITVTGIIREIDLDARRFEIRQIVGSEAQYIRCIYSPELENGARQLLDQKVKVSGIVERNSLGKPRLLEISKLEKK